MGDGRIDLGGKLIYTLPGRLLIYTGMLSLRLIMAYQQTGITLPSVLIKE